VSHPRNLAKSYNIIVLDYLVKVARDFNLGFFLSLRRKGHCCVW